jgi:hypothetical protein
MLVVIRAAFWKFAHRRYHARPMSIAMEYSIAAWVVTIIAAFGIFLFLDFDHAFRYLVLGVVLAVVPSAIALLHRVIRLEKAKSRHALLNKRREAETGPRTTRRTSLASPTR